MLPGHGWWPLNQYLMILLNARALKCFLELSYAVIQHAVMQILKGYKMNKFKEPVIRKIDSNFKENNQRIWRFIVILVMIWAILVIFSNWWKPAQLVVLDIFNLCMYRVRATYQSYAFFCTVFMYYGLNSFNLMILFFFF